MEWFIALYLFAGVSHFIWDKEEIRCNKPADRMVIFLICLFFWPVVTIFKAAS